METSRRVAVKVGALLFAAVAVAFVVVALLGAERMWFKDKVSLRATFPDIAGLQEGAPVQLGGRPVGMVKKIYFDPAADRTQAIVVELELLADHAEMVKKDSVARIGAKGLLGDKLLAISIGGKDAAAIEDGDTLPSEAPSDPSQLFSVATDAATHARNILRRLDETTKNMGEGGGLGDASAALSSARRILERVETGPGTLHEVIYGDELAREAQRSVAKIGDAAEEFDRVAGAVETEAVKALVADASRAARNAAELTDAVDKDALRRASRDVADIVAHVKSGKGTLGGLIMDPTLYEETKRILVSIRRNRVLKALARYVVSKDEPSAIMDGDPQRVVVVRPRHAPGVEAPAPGLDPKVDAVQPETRQAEKRRDKRGKRRGKRAE